MAERVDHWGLTQAYLHSTGKGLPDKSLEIARPWRREDVAETKPKKDRYQKQRERAAFFGYAETG